jgi:hypothetical protein
MQAVVHRLCPSSGSRLLFLSGAHSAFPPPLAFRSSAWSSRSGRSLGCWLCLQCQPDASYSSMHAVALRRSVGLQPFLSLNVYRRAVVDAPPSLARHPPLLVQRWVCSPLALHVVVPLGMLRRGSFLRSFRTYLSFLIECPRYLVLKVGPKAATVRQSRCPAGTRMQARGH